MPKIAQKRQTTLKNAFKTQETSTPVKKLAQTASTSSATFSISAVTYVTYGVNIATVTTVNTMHYPYPYTIALFCNQIISEESHLFISNNLSITFWQFLNYFLTVSHSVFVSFCQFLTQFLAVFHFFISTGT